jgi:thioredoxin-dependent peroxiredoxin
MAYRGDQSDHVPALDCASRAKDEGKMLEAGQPFPDFALPDQNGKTRKLSDYAGKWLVVYFYPKDDTPGCTVQGKSMTASKADYDKSGVSIVGVSQDDVTSHKKFCTKFSFTIDLLADTRADLIKACGVNQGEWQGMKFWERTSFIVDPKGIVRKTFGKVNPNGHEKVLLDAIKELQKQHH